MWYGRQVLERGEQHAGAARREHGASGTSCQSGSSSYGSEATTVPVPGSVRYQRLSPQAVAAMVAPSVSSRFSREAGAASASSRTAPPRASAGSSPRRSRCRTSAQTNAESVLACRDSSSTGGRADARGAAESGQPAIMPLWLKSHRPSAKGAAAASASAPATVASRTAASTAPARTTRARSAKDRSAQIGPARR